MWASTMKTSLSRVLRPHSAKLQRRGMAGLVKKNYYVEEWNGRREITEKAFKYNVKTTTNIVLAALLFPSLIYYVMRDELEKKYQKRGQHHPMM